MTGPQLRRTRKALGLTQEQLAEALGVTRVTVTNWEAGKHPIDRVVAMAVEHLGCAPPPRIRRRKL